MYVLFLGWLLTCGLIIYGAVIKYRAGEGAASSIIWGFTTSAWVWVVGLMVGLTWSHAASIIWYLCFVAWLAVSLWLRLRADEYFIEQFGSLRRYRVRYLGGHPSYRQSPVRGELLVTQSGLVFLNRYRAGAAALFAISVDRIGHMQAGSAVSSVVVWSGPGLLPVSVARGDGTLAVEFCNDLNGRSVATFGLGTLHLAFTLKNDIEYAIYDWQRSAANQELERT